MKSDDRERLWSGPDCQIESRRRGAVVNFRSAGQWGHPWQIAMSFEDEWRATVRPGFVNGRPAFIDMPAWWLAEQVRTGATTPRDFGINPLTGRPYFEAWVFNSARKGSRTSTVNKGPGGPVRLTNRAAPYLVLKDWRDPAGPGAPTVGSDGSLRTGRSEGYPAYFAELGVRPVAGAPEDEARTREIRAMDILLVQPREGASLNFQPGSPIGDVSTAQISTDYHSDYYNLQEGRTKLRQTTRYSPPGESTIEATFGTLLEGGEPQFDELLMATVWMVSPPDAGSDAVPDGTWEPHVQHFVFWNLWHATQAIPPGADDSPIIFIMPLALGTAQGILNGIISSLNGMLAEALAFLRKSGSLTGKFWTT